MQRILAATAAVLIMLIVAGFVAIDMLRSGHPIAEAGPLPVGQPHFALIDHRGRSVTEADFRGRPLLVYFGYTWCPDVCPTELSIIADALDLLGPLAQGVEVLFVSIDDGRDTPEVLARYVEAFHERITGLTGSATAIAAAAAAFGARYSRTGVPGSAHYDYIHSSRTLLLDAEGRVVASFPYRSPAAEMAAAVRRLLVAPGTAP